jgi:hypothetical protein
MSWCQAGKNLNSKFINVDSYSIFFRYYKKIITDLYHIRLRLVLVLVKRTSSCTIMRSLPFTFSDLLPSCGDGLGLTHGREELSIIRRGIRFLLGEDILGGEKSMSVPPEPEPEPGGPFSKVIVLLLAAAGVLVVQSSGIRNANSSMSPACRFGVVRLKLGTAPPQSPKSVKVETAGSRSKALTKICGEIIVELRYWYIVMIM